MPNVSSAIVSKVWNYAHVLKNAGVGCGDYVEVRAARASTNLPFLKPSDAPQRAKAEKPALLNRLAWRRKPRQAEWRK